MRCGWQFLVAMMVLSARAVAVSAGDFAHDFRTQEFDHASFERVGSAADQCVEATKDGLRIKFQDGKVHGPTGVSLRFHVPGDFEITAAYEITSLDPPTDGYGVGVGLYVETGSPTKEGLTLERFVAARTNDKEIYSSTRVSMPNGTRTYTTQWYPAPAVRSGRLRLTRRGSMVTAAVAEGDATSFRVLRRVEVAAEDLYYVRLAGDNGGSTSRLDALIQDLQIINGDIPPESPDPAPVVAPPAAAPVPIVPLVAAAPAVAPPVPTGLPWTNFFQILIAGVVVALLVLLGIRTIRGRK